MTTIIKSYLRKTPLYRVIILLRLFRGFVRWRDDAYAAPSPYFVKAEVLLRNSLPNASWVETGTYLGDTTALLSKHGQFVYSIEPEPSLYTKAIERFQSSPNIKIVKGLSEEVFPNLLPKLSGNFNFWLDGHYSSGVTHKGPKDTPILDELASIALHMKNFTNISVMIDDIRCFNPTISEFSTYPQLKQIVDWAEENKLVWHIEHDIFIARSMNSV